MSDLCLQWNDFKQNISATFENLRKQPDFTDVTLACEDGQMVEALRIILVASSPVFQSMLRRSNHNRPLIYLRGISSEDLNAIVDFVYFGETTVREENLNSFLAVAEELQLKGLIGLERDNRTEKEKSIRKPSFAKSSKELRTEREEESNKKKISKSIHDPQNIVKKENTDENARSAENMTKTNELYSKIQDLDKRVKSMIEKASDGGSGVRAQFKCKTCGKIAESPQMRNHIESLHLEGVSLPCELCEKVFRTRNSLSVHKSRDHKGFA